MIRRQGTDPTVARSRQGDKRRTHPVASALAAGGSTWWFLALALVGLGATLLAARSVSPMARPRSDWDMNMDMDMGRARAIPYHGAIRQRLAATP
jgi:hypothetical protein